MNRPTRWGVRVSPEVDEILITLARRRPSAKLIADFIGGLDRLAHSGTRATGAKKRRSFDLWEIRVSDHRAFFCPVPGTDLQTLEALESRKTRKVRMERLRVIERKVHRWRDMLETGR